jgi:hypothetical protein
LIEGLYTVRGARNQVTMAQQELPEHLKSSIEGSKAEYVRLGNSGLRVSVPIFGAMSIGDRRTLPWCIEKEKVSFSLTYFSFSYNV